jgi:hypothetical protein
LIIQRAVEDEFDAWLGRARYERRPAHQRGLRNYDSGASQRLSPAPSADACGRARGPDPAGPRGGRSAHAHDGRGAACRHGCPRPLRERAAPHAVSCTTAARAAVTRVRERRQRGHPAVNGPPNCGPVKCVFGCPGGVSGRVVAPP